MNRITSLAGTALAIVILFTAAACSKGGASGGAASLVGKWKVSEIKINGKSMEEAVEEQLAKDGSADEASKELAKGMMKGMMESFMQATAEFTEDGKCTIAFAGQTQTATYKVSEDGKSVTFEGEGASSMSVSDLSSDSFTLEQASGDNEKVQMVFKKQ